jgi:hypothetical protein
MQNGSMMRTERHGGPDVWEFGWREPGPDGKRKHRRMVVGTTNEFGDEVAARQAVAGLHLCMNSRSERVRVQITVSELVDHYRQRELKPDILWKTHSTKVTYEGYEGYLNKWSMPRWGNYTLNRISAGEVELWLRSLALAIAAQSLKLVFKGRVWIAVIVSRRGGVEKLSSKHTSITKVKDQFFVQLVFGNQIEFVADVAAGARMGGNGNGSAAGVEVVI